MKNRILGTSMTDMAGCKHYLASLWSWFKLSHGSNRFKNLR